MLILLTFFIWKIIDLLIAYLSPNYLSYLGHFSYATDLLKSNLPRFIYSWANFDAMFYLRIASKGYQQYEQAFFPLYPLLIRFIYQIIKIDRIIIGLIISNLSFLISLFVLSKYLGNKRNFIWIVLFLLAFPTSFYFGAIYTESLFFMLFILSLYFLKKNKIITASVFGYLLALTRMQGVFILIPFIIYIVNCYRKNQQLKKLLLLFIMPIIGLLTYMGYLWKTTGNPVYFLYAQTAFGQGRSTNIIFLPQVYFRYLKIILFANHDLAYFRALFEVTSFTIVFCILLYLIYKITCRDGACPVSTFKLKISKRLMTNEGGLLLFSLAYILTPTVSGTFLSVPRMILLCLPFFIWLAKIKSQLIKAIILLIFIILHIVCLSLFIQGYFVS